MRGRLIVIVALLAFAGAAVLGGVGDWVWWQPFSGIVITLAAVAILLAAILLAVIRRTRPVALLVVAVGAGLIAGQNLGPSRAPLLGSDGTMTVTLTAPRATTGTTTISCSMDTAATEVSVSGDPNLRLDILPDDPSAPADIDQREFVGVGVTVGDRWDQGPSPRRDTVVLTMLVGQVQAGLPETRMRSASSSTLELDRSARHGTLSFRGLVPDTRSNEPAGAPIDLAGTLTWDCG